MLCHRNINYFRKSISLSKLCHNININHQLSQFSVLANRESLLESIKKSYKSEELSEYLSNINLKKTGTKQTKIERLFQHFESQYV